ncbi:hypothetical protein MCO_00320 [Bartonella sp. DB5-6]|nr:hypothetical protein MCO_00320 [Bartonella sp. DB5-6]
MNCQILGFDVTFSITYFFVHFLGKNDLLVVCADDYWAACDFICSFIGCGFLNVWYINLEQIERKIVVLLPFSKSF